MARRSGRRTGKVMDILIVGAVNENGRRSAKIQRKKKMANGRTPKARQQINNSEDNTHTQNKKKRSATADPTRTNGVVRKKRKKKETKRKRNETALGQDQRSKNCTEDYEDERKTAFYVVKRPRRDRKPVRLTSDGVDFNSKQKKKNHAK